MPHAERRLIFTIQSGLNPHCTFFAEQFARRAAFNAYQQDLPEAGFASQPAIPSFFSLLYVLSELLLSRFDSHIEMFYNSDPIPKGWHYCRK